VLQHSPGLIPPLSSLRFDSAADPQYDIYDLVFDPAIDYGGRLLLSNVPQGFQIELRSGENGGHHIWTRAPMLAGRFI